MFFTEQAFILIIILHVGTYLSEETKYLNPRVLNVIVLVLRCHCIPRTVFRVFEAEQSFSIDYYLVSKLFLDRSV